MRPKKKASDVLKFEKRLKQKEDIVDDVQRENAIASGRDYYRDEMYLLYECRAFSFKYTNNKINLWKSTGLNNYTSDSDMDAVSIGTTDLPSLVDNGRMSVKLAGAYFKQTKLIRPNNNNVINIIDPIFRLSDYTVQNNIFTVVNKKCVLSLHYNGDNSYLFVNGKQELKFKAKDDQIVKEILCLGNISDDWTTANAEKTVFWGEI